MPIKLPYSVERGFGYSLPTYPNRFVVGCNKLLYWRVESTTTGWFKGLFTTIIWTINQLPFSFIHANTTATTLPANRIPTRAPFCPHIKSFHSSITFANIRFDSRHELSIIVVNINIFIDYIMQSILWGPLPTPIGCMGTVVFTGVNKGPPYECN